MTAERNGIKKEINTLQLQLKKMLEESTRIEARVELSRKEYKLLEEKKAMA